MNLSPYASNGLSTAKNNRTKKIFTILKVRQHTSVISWFHGALYLSESDWSQCQLRLAPHWHTNAT